MQRFSIDGEKFRSAFCRESEWPELVAGVKKAWQEGKFHSTRYTILAPNTESAAATSLGLVDRGVGKLKPFKLAARGFQMGWRPVLDPDIPLSEKDMPDGSTSTGGSLYVAMPGEDFQCVPAPGPSNPIVYQDGMRFRIGDTGSPEQTLAWVACNGRLIGQTVLVVNTSLETLKTLV